MKKIFTLTLLLTLFTHAAYSQGSGHALNFDGNNDYILVGNNNDFLFPQNTGVFTLEAWVQFDQLTGKGNTILSSGLATAEKCFSFLLETRPGSNFRRLRLFLGRGVGGSPTIDSYTAINVISDNDWHHVAAVGDGSNITFYVDGISYAGTNSIGTLSTGNASRPTRIGDFFSGAYGIGTVGYVDGHIDEVRIWNAARSATEIQENMCQKLNGSEPNLVAYYRMDEGVDNSCTGGEDVCDLTGNGNHGTKF